MLPVRNYGLDLLRILLCLTVVFFHYSGGWNCGGSVVVDVFWPFDPPEVSHKEASGNIAGKRLTPAAGAVDCLDCRFCRSSY